MIISTDTEKACDNIQHPFMMKALSKAGVKGKYFNIINVIYDKPTTNITLKGENLKVIPLRLGTSKGFKLSSVLFNILLEVLARVIREKNKLKKIKIGKEKNNICLQMIWYCMLKTLKLTHTHTHIHPKPVRTNKWIQQSCRIQNHTHKKSMFNFLGLPWWYSSWESALQCKDMHLTPGRGAKLPHDTEQPSPCPTVTEPAHSAAHTPQLESPRTTAKIPHGTAKILQN